MRQGFLLVLTVLTAIVTTGCLATGYKGESFPATDEVIVLPRGSAPPAGYTLIGRGWVAGEASATTRKELEARMEKLARKHGADALVVMGMTLVPEGRKVDDSEENVIAATSDPDQTHTLISFRQELDSVTANGTSTRFERRLYADFFRQTEGAAKPAETAKPAEPVKSEEPAQPAETVGPVKP